MRHRIVFVARAGRVLSAACGGQGPIARVHAAGQMLSVAADHKEANIKHEEIKGFMPAMTMPYKVRDAKEFDGSRRAISSTRRSWSSATTPT